MSRARGLILLLAPWALVPVALDAGVRYAARHPTSLENLALFTQQGAFTVIPPAIVLLLVERRISRQTALMMLLALTVGAAVWIAGGAGVLSALALALLLQVAAYGYGGMLAGALRLGAPEHAWRGMPMLVTIGWAILIVIALAAGALGILTQPVVVTIVVAGLAAAAAPRRSRSAPGEAPPGSGSPSLVWWWGFAVLVLVGLVGAVAPEVRHDALAAHLPIAREFAARGAIVEMRTNEASYFQLSADLVYGMAMVLHPGDAVPKLLHTFAGVWASLLVFDIGARRWGAAVGLAAAAVVAGTELVWWVGGSAYTDLWVMLFTVAMLGAVDRYLRAPGPGPAVVVGLMAGAAVGVKITGVIGVAPLTLVFVIAALRRRPRRVRDVMVMLAMVALAGAFWYVRAWWLTGNPVFPLLERLSQGDFVRHSRRVHIGSATTFGMGRTPGDLLLLPWRTARYPTAFVETSTIGSAYLALTPAILLAAARGQVPRWMLGAAGGATLIWIATAQYLRYVLPGLPLWALIGAAGLFARGPLAPRPAFGAGVLAVVLALGAWTWALQGSPDFPLEVVQGRTSRTAYLERHAPGFAVADHIRRALPASARVYGVDHEPALIYYTERFFVSAEWYGRVFRLNLYAVFEAPTGSDVAAILRQAGFTHLVVNSRYVRIPVWRSPGAWLGRERFWEDGPPVVYARDGYYIFDLRP